MKSTYLASAAVLLGLATSLTARPMLPVVDDNKIISSLADGLGKLVDAGKVPTAKTLAPQLKKKTCKITVPSPSTQKPENLYDSCADSVVAIASVYKCTKCPHWHHNGAATGWILTEDGVMVTNYHVFDGKDVSGFGIRTRDGRIAQVVEILAASQKDDVAIFRVAGEGFKPLALGPDARVGDDLHIIAHPDTRFYTYTSGKVSRYYKKRSRKRNGATAMAVTAEFARGSSGGPALDSKGNVVGMVSSTQSIYYPSQKKSEAKGPFQMVIRNCVPVSAIRALVEPVAK
ncbi:trypsin-like peptidase domain-containing protein [Verrucomicrobiaceae bacterium R5-34]|uniref:Trypsin-like peptidase domain-containing protein n=1 Tax=Oceaniferula flava TaxID=2800421 RepID=A0AAE2SEC2_9BACT|nr:serine protease [Oceaniferula flavus]MBK1830175.1 trypsin-like peptidase domain-containing protein [Verrucomicrobiaceae bacterium R5-34]MBK1854766.1 trypsin-like peptidase domain-containing protein [Oceaniferula flavus]MBM1136072.1 trypsin-like peptidase domain-containing protein [Oceaniferula flavus]